MAVAIGVHSVCQPAAVSAVFQSFERVHDVIILG
jgi:hypothetical protein